MADAPSTLAALQLEPLEAVQPLAHAECVRIARRLERQTIGFYPVDARVAVPAAVIQLGLALADVRQATVAFVDANLRQPAFVGISGELDTASGGKFAMRWLHGSLALLQPRAADAARPAGTGIAQLSAIIGRSRELFSHILVDLTGFDQLGDHLAAIELLDGVVVVARAGQTRETALLAAYHEMPADRRLGVLLVG